MCKYVTLLRVSTAKQGADGLGIDAQRATVEAFAKARGCEIIFEFVEVESGRKTKRPQLQAAIDMAAITGAQLLIARLDRLARNVGFMCKLRDEGVDFLACDYPDANKFTVNLLASVAEEYSDSVSRNTKAAMAAAKRRGVRLGGPLGAKAFGLSYHKGSAAGVQTMKDKAKAHALKIAATVRGLHAEGITSLASIADALNARHIRTSRKGQWHPTSVARLLARIPA